MELGVGDVLESFVTLRRGRILFCFFRGILWRLMMKICGFRGRLGSRFKGSWVF